MSIRVRGRQARHCPARYAALWLASQLCLSSDAEAVHRLTISPLFTGTTWLHSPACVSLHARASSAAKTVSTLTVKHVYPDVTVTAHVPKWTRLSLHFSLRGVKGHTRTLHGSEEEEPVDPDGTRISVLTLRGTARTYYSTINYKS